MSGKPAARQGDMTQYGGPIVQGSAGVRIGAPTGVACSVCPGGMTSGNPVNPLLGAKVLPGETDLALPGPLPFILSRTYSSYRTRTPAPVGVFGPGWKAPSDIRLQLRDDALVLNDNGGRSIHFEPLLPGEAVCSRSESMWLVRGGKAAQPDGHTLARLWGALPPDIRLSPHLYLATNSAQGPWWILGWSERVPGAEDVLPAPLPPYRVLTGLADRFGRTLTYRREAAGDLAGEITGVTDGAGREFRLVLTTQAQRAEEARTSSLSSSDSSRPLSASAFPDTLPGTEYGPDRGIRLSAVWLMHDPAYPESLPAAPLVRYTYTEAGELLAVYDRSNTQVRAFTYDAQHPGRMVAHRYAGRPEMRYRYDDTGRVVEQLNPAGLSYRYLYEQDRITVTDSLNRREVLHTEGGAGLKRVVKKELADGSVTRSGYDAAGRLTAQTDAAGRRTEYGLNVVSGDITDITTPDGRETKFYYNDGNQLTAVVYPDGLESRREYDEPGRLVSETSRSGDVIRYAYDNPHSELPATTTDATGSTRQMTWSRYGQLLAFTDCSGYQTRYEYDRFGQMTAVHREEGISLYRRYDNRGRLTSVKDAQGRETRYEYNAAGDLTAVITPDGNRSETQYDAWGKAVSTTQGGLTRSMEYDAAGRVISLTNENGSHSVFSYDALDRLVQQGGFDGRTQRYHYDLTGKLTQSEGDLVRISGPRQTREYGYSATGRLESVRTLAPDLDIRIPYATDPAGNRLPDPELHPDSTLTAWPDNRIAEDAHYVYHYDEYGRLTEKTDRIPTGVIRTDDERTHHYHYDSQHRLVFHTRIQHGEPLVESRYLYDPLGRRMAKRVWRRERDLTGWMSLSRKPEETWYGWDGDRLTTVQTDTTRIQTVYQPGSFAPLIRIETDNGEREKAQRRSLAEKLQQEGSEDGHGVVFPAELVRLLDRLEEEIRADRVSSESRQWLAQCGLTVEQLARQVEPEYTPARKVHFYHCDHRGLPLALISEDGNTAWRGEYDEWGNQLNEENPHHLHQPYRLPGQQHDEESGLYYNRHRHYDPLQGRYITPDPIGLRGGWNMYQYPLNPIQVIDPMGLDAIENMTSGGLIYAVSGVPGLIAANSITNSAYQFGYDMDAIVGGAHNGAADAMRHCYLMCRMTKTFGSTIADVIGKNHEAAGDRQGQPAKERIMDLKNNTVGIACGDFSAKCSDACIEKYNTGQLFGLDGIKADNPIKAKQGSSDASNY
ncbi:RHS repeat-associated core domain-containing protein [Escherichia coli]|uniref:RHS repeat-associated core domain-containing protein n=1 Tax=Escherichia coli TaxID=562 RepID=UPI001411F7BC|nr:RHS repeat-associated core domain-containing protein [Escherichia coli]NHV24187.1 RHS repeat protein [Escherichia coli]NHW43715.1 RHS repeat protein [Escherichia coli]